ncbi:MAG: MFS transporter, partial [Candidatus Saccharimonadales bacterium]
ALGLSVGPVIGGFILGTLGWRWVFWVNVPFGLVASVFGWLVIPPTSGLTRGSRFDWTGAFLIVPALATLIASINEAHVWGLISPAFFSGVAVAAVLLFMFTRSELNHNSPLVDFSLFKSGAFVAGNVAGLMSYATLFGIFFLMPFVFIRVFHDDPFTAGLRLAIIPVMIGLFAPFAGALSDRFGARLLTVAGMVLCLGGLAYLYLAISVNSASFPAVMLALAAFGAGQGLFASPNNNSIIAAAPERLTGAAGSFVNVVRSVGMSAGIAAASAILSWRLEALIGHPVNTVRAPTEILLRAGRDDILSLIAFAAVAGLISLICPHGTPDA